MWSSTPFELFLSCFEKRDKMCVSVAKILERIAIGRLVLDPVLDYPNPSGLKDNLHTFSYAE
ncbi:hypothetical protein ColTof4_07153 [Colletotrichum tofieldiae]|nr:hypothetical protein ColTof3_12095 [Colletotrichum tofieldiae]GKT74730.1 hypothetical protein ColTof4_07153 [Colletotrichum tofieldiae]GKT91919.1 hypothetical protein Ct61P_09769 [Colletotrichum tofieldiae]